MLAEAPAPPEGWLGPGDDAAVRPAGAAEALTIDTMVEGTHWDDHLSPEDVGWKLVAVNASDLGAMGAEPEWALLALTLPEPLDLGWVDGFARGLGAGLRHFGLHLAGGDTTRGPTRVASLTVGGRLGGPALRRSGARPGDELWVTGVLGRAAEGLLAAAPRPEALGHLRRPQPPVGLGVALRAAGCVHAMMDLSDGLHRDLGRMCGASGVGATVQAAALPGDAGLAEKVAFGEDYELLFAAPPEAGATIRALAARMGVRVTVIGRVEAVTGLRIVDAPGWPAPLFQHFLVPAP